MPYLLPSWRKRDGLKWLSRIWCYFGRHYWFHSTQTKKPIICASCGKKTKHYHPEAY